MDAARKFIIMRFAIFVVFLSITSIGLFYTLTLIRDPVVIKREEAAQTDVGVTLYTSPSNINALKGDSFTVDLNISAMDETVTGADISVSFDPEFLKVHSVTKGDFFPKVVRPGVASNGSVTIMLGTEPGDFRTGDGTIASISFSARRTGTTGISYTEISQVSASETTVNVLASTMGATVNISESPEVKSISNAAVATEIVIYASGTEAQGQYPTMELYVGSERTAIFYGIAGEKRKYVYVHPVEVKPGEVRVKFINDLNDRRSGRDRNLRVDKLTLNGKEFQTESDSIYSVGGWSRKGCGSGYTKSEWLFCNGEFVYTE